jgi:hypothetical protein
MHGPRFPVGPSPASTTRVGDRPRRVPTLSRRRPGWRRRCAGSTACPYREVITSPSGRTLLDFGQNLVGRVRLEVAGPAGTVITLRHAEVLEHGELGTRPLRGAAATDRYTLRGGGGVETWEPEFTFHGFRYAEVEGWPGTLDPGAITAVVVHSDMARTGWFSCSDDLVNPLHENVVWGQRGNFLSVPTDCPQRDERLGCPDGDLPVRLPGLPGVLAGRPGLRAAGRRRRGAVRRPARSSRAPSRGCVGRCRDGGAERAL